MDDVFGLLFARPSFLEGIARTLDLGNTLAEYNYSLTAAQADYLALKNDWNVVGSDMQKALVAFEKILEKEGIDVGERGAGN